MTHRESAQKRLPEGFALHSFTDGARGRTWFVENKATESHIVSYQKTPKAAVDLALQRIEAARTIYESNPKPPTV